jgi:hypothetical protein
MNQDATLHRIADAIFEEAKTDAVGLWAIHWEVRNVLPHLGDQAARDATFRIVDIILSSGAVPGEFSGDVSSHQFKPWHVSVPEAIHRIQTEWTNLGRAPDIGEIVWFIAAEAARK